MDKLNIKINIDGNGWEHIKENLITVLMKKISSGALGVIKALGRKRSWREFVLIGAVQ